MFADIIRLWVLQMKLQANSKFVQMEVTGQLLVALAQRADYFVPLAWKIALNSISLSIFHPGTAGLLQSIAQLVIQSIIQLETNMKLLISRQATAQIAA